MRPSVAVVSTVVNSENKLWTVAWHGDFDVEGVGGFDERLQASTHTEVLRTTIESTHTDRPGLRFLVEGDLTATRFATADKEWRTPYELTRVHRLVVESVGAPTSTLFKEVGLGSLYRAIGAHFRLLAQSNPELFGLPRALPKPGQPGHPDAYYAQWASRIVKAREAYGRGYMKHLLDQSPGYTRSNLLRILDRAERLGLYVSSNEKGKLGRGELTAKCEALLVKGIDR